MIEYATADLTGCIITTDTGTTRATTWRNAHAETVKVSQASNFSKESSTTDSAFLICTDAEPWIYTRAMHELISEGKKLTMMKLARRIQKHELANLKVTGAPKEHSDVGNEYDGTTVTRETMSEEGYLADSDERHYNYTQLRGTRGRKDNITRLPSIPPRRAAALDSGMFTIRARMIAEREATLRAHEARIKIDYHDATPSFPRPARYHKEGTVTQRVRRFNLNAEPIRRTFITKNGQCFDVTPTPYRAPR